MKIGAIKPFGSNNGLVQWGIKRQKEGGGKGEGWIAYQSLADCPLFPITELSQGSERKCSRYLTRSFSYTKRVLKIVLVVLSS